MSIEFVTTPDGSRKVVMSEADFQDLLDARDHAEAMRGLAAGAPTFAEAEVDAYLAARTPLAFWRQRAGLTQKALADKSPCFAGVPSSTRGRRARRWGEGLGPAR